MTSVQWLISMLGYNDILDHNKLSENEELYKLYQELKARAKEMHKQEIENTYWDGGQYIPMNEKSCEQYYQETFVCKGSDDHIVDTNEMVDVPQQEISDEEIEKMADELEYYTISEIIMWENGAKWYREQLRLKVDQNQKK